MLMGLVANLFFFRWSGRVMDTPMYFAFGCEGVKHTGVSHHLSRPLTRRFIFISKGHQSVGILAV